MSQPIIYEPVIGLEVHIQLLTKSKLFCADANSFSEAPNTAISEISLALPGTLPVINKEAIQLGIQLGVACNATVNTVNYFARKHYFYPDSPKAFQTTQDEAPIFTGGYLPISIGDAVKNIEIHHAHLEEDAGKSIHDMHDDYTFIDLNRAGTPLIELVTQPCLHSAEEAALFVTQLRRLVRWLGISDGNMEEGSIRADVNVSLKPKGSTTLGTRVEVKNVNSIRFIKKAIECEIERLTQMLQQGKTIVQETRGFNANDGSTYSLREKEDAHDYRYMPEPDLMPVIIEPATIHHTTNSLPELPWALEHKYVNTFGLTNGIAKQLTDDKDINNYFEALYNACGNAKAAANWITGPIQQYCNEATIAISDYPLSVQKIAEIIEIINTGKINYQIATAKLLPLLYKTPEANINELCATNELIIADNANEIETWVNEVLDNMPDKVAEYKKGKKGLLSLFTGQVMKKSKGKANANIVNEIILKKLV
jgi:aspartyl-tRNA(Asn)/glutamyl-tRNA(Gln) amidotransferase subunit B